MGQIVWQVSYDDLVKLLGGDAQVEIELRHGIAETFAKHHLKAVANSLPMKEALDRLLIGFQQEVDRQIGGVVGNYPKKVKLAPNVQKEIEDIVRRGKTEVINEILGNFQEHRWPHLRAELESRVVAEVERRMAAGFERLVQDEVARRLEQVRKALG